MLNIEYMWGLLPVLLRYLPLTLQMATIAMCFALILACLLAVVRVSKVPMLNGLSLLFISFFRGTPLLVQLFLFYYGLPQLISSLIAITGVTAAVLGLTLHFSAYMAESIRAAIVGIDRSQTRVATPTLMNYFIDMIKATSLAFTLGVTELMGATQKEAAGSFLYLEAFLLVALIYWAVVEVLSWGQRRLEIYLNKAYQR
mgnify:CR=1 FL=1